MKVIVESNLTIQNIFEPPIEFYIDDEAVTLRDLLEKVSNTCTTIQLLRDGELGDDLRNISVNGKEYFSLPNGLRTILKDGDTVNLEIYMEPLGGG